MNSRQKGARGERMAAAAWAQVVGGTARRGQQFSGSPDSPDVVTDNPAIHLEVKNVERGNPYDWLDQAVRDAGDKLPIVLHKRNFHEWIAIVRLTDVPRLAKEIGAQAQAVGAVAVPGEVPGEGLPPGPGVDGGPHGLPPDVRRRRTGTDCNRCRLGPGEPDRDVPGGVGSCPHSAPHRRTGGNR